ncbi:hypothetical protein ACQPZF_26420 [Actinosynnema sp. CS-041913]|uniref:hypothetical protein n=1 Tax=Actinosynnema sp. CS-041913 TaxID=3239917 RepID=UPI003D8DF9AD
MSRRLVEDYPALRNAALFGSDAATALLTGGRVVPVLDGLDELPSGLHTAAIEALDRATRGTPFVVTCRSAEYEQAVGTGGSVLATAAVIELERADVTEVIGYLSAGPAGDGRWASVFAELRDAPDGHVATALSQPLISALARTVYAGDGTGPDELLDRSRFPDRGAVEEHVLDAFVPAAYHDHPSPPGLHRTKARYPPGEARAWLSFLAGYLSRRATRDLAWWELHQALPRPWRTSIGVVLQLVSSMVCGLGIGIFAGLPVGLTAGAVGGLVKGALVRPPAHPRRINARHRGVQGFFLRKLPAGLIIGLTPVAVVGVAAEFCLGLVVGLSPDRASE